MPTVCVASSALIGAGWCTSGESNRKPRQRAVGTSAAQRDTRCRAFGWKPDGYVARHPRLVKMMGNGARAVSRTRGTFSSKSHGEAVAPLPKEGEGGAEGEEGGEGGEELADISLSELADVVPHRKVSGRDIPSTPFYAQRITFENPLSKQHFEIQQLSPSDSN